MRWVVAGALCCAGIAATLLLLPWPRHREGPPHAFRVVSDPYGERPSKLVWGDGKARPLSLGEYVTSRVMSPDRREVVFGGWDDGGLRFVDLVRRRIFVVPNVVASPPGGCTATPQLWSPMGRVVATGWCGDAHSTAASTLAVVDAARGRIVSTASIGLVLRSAHAGGRSVVLTSPPLGPVFPGTYEREERLGPARLIRIDRDGSVARVVLRINAGYANSRTFNREPGLAVRGERAVVVGEGEDAADVDLRTLRVRYHRVPFPPRPRQLAPAPKRHEGTTNPSRDLVRQAYWIDGRYVAVVGYDNWTHRGHDQSLAAGLRILDTRTWTARIVDARAWYARTTRGLVLAWSVDPDGLRVYDAAGRIRFRAFRGLHVFVDEIRGNRATVSAWRRPGARARRFTVELPTGLTRH